MQITNSSSWLNKFDHASKFLIPFEEGAHSEAIKIAILDTGCDLENKFFCGPGIDFVDDLMVRWLDCVGGTREPVDEDPHSHGTAMAALLLRLVPRATIYIVRVARDSNGLSAAKEIFAEVCRYYIKSFIMIAYTPPTGYHSGGQGVGRGYYLNVFWLR